MLNALCKCLTGITVISFPVDHEALTKDAFYLDFRMQKQAVEMRNSLFKIFFLRGCGIQGSKDSMPLNGIFFIYDISNPSMESFQKLRDLAIDKWVQEQKKMLDSHLIKTVASKFLILTKCDEIPLNPDKDFQTQYLAVTKEIEKMCADYNIITDSISAKEGKNVNEVILLLSV
jgi:hypothetical protein